MAHDIKNPLAIIKTSADLLKRKLKKGNAVDEKTERILGNMDMGISRMSHQIRDVLDYVRVTPVNVKESSLKSIINTALESINVPNNISINVPESDVSIQCDVRKMEIVFINLILNAIQAIGSSSSGSSSSSSSSSSSDNDKKLGNITIQVVEEPDHFIITVQNSGDPIPNDIIDKIFDPLFTTKYQGTGLGLSTCKNVIEQHGGTIKAENNPTRFVIHFPKKVSIKF